MKHPLGPEVRRRLEAYCGLLAAAGRSLTAVPEEELWERHVEDALSALALVERLAPVGMVDVGSGNGSPGIPLALASGVATTLLEARAPRAAFLRGACAALSAPCSVVHARSEIYARASGRDAFDLALARALAPPPVAAELCLPLLRPGGAALLWTGEADAGAVARTALELGGELVAVHPVAGARRLLELRKQAPTPERFPRRPGLAAKRPLASLPSTP